MNYSSLREVTEQELVDYFSDLFWTAFKRSPFEVVCALLRVSGMQDAEWDPFEESIEAFEDYNTIRKLKDDAITEKTRWRIGLLTYCQAVEMTAPQEFLANLLRILNGKKYHMKPFGRLGRSNKKRPFSWVPPSAPVKYRELKELAKKVGQTPLCEYIEQFFDENIRNAFAHSDYVIAAEHFRWTESGLPQEISLEKVNLLVHNCFRFFSVLLWLHGRALSDLSKLPKYHKWPNYEVLELLSNSGKLYGFSVHFSNGTKATYARTPGRVDCINMLFDSDGSFEFMVGLLEDLEPVWKIDGKPFEGGA